MNYTVEEDRGLASERKTNAWRDSFLKSACFTFACCRGCPKVLWPRATQNILVENSCNKEDSRRPDTMRVLAPP